MKKQLLRLLNDGFFHSGQDLAQALCISRGAVWKQVQSLNRLGLEIDAVRGRGYRLRQSLELLDRERIEQGLSAHARALLQRLEIHDEIESTSTHLARGASAPCSSGTVCFAERQTAGRGRMGREWISPFGRNLAVSVAWRFDAGPGALTGLSLGVGVAVIRALEKADISDVGLKWPNDIIWQGRKLGGILVEVSGESLGPCFVVVGLGLNVHMPESAGRAIDQEWADIERMGLADRPSRNHLAALMLSELLPLLASYERTGLRPYLDDWKAWDCLIGAEVTLRLGDRSIAGTALGITDDGRLLVEDETGAVEPYFSGEVTVRSWKKR